MLIKLPIDLSLLLPMERPASPYGKCGQCYYVGTDIQLGTACPACSASQVGNCGRWPSPEFNELWDDVVFAWNNERAEIAAVVSATYLEASVFDLMKWGTHWLDPDLNWIDAELEDVGSKSERIWAHLLNVRSQAATDDALKHLFGVNGKEMLQTVLGDDAVPFWQNYRRLADFRNQIVHQGRRVWYRTVNTSQARAPADQMLTASMYFVPTCWVVFSKLWNEYIHKPMLAE